MSKSTKTMTDAQGRAIPVEYVKPHDRARDRLVKSIHRDADRLNRQIANFRDKTLRRIIEFQQRGADKYDVEIGGNKGNITLRSFDGLIKVQLAVAAHIDFDERLSVAQQLIDEYLDEITDGANQDLAKLVRRAFYSDAQGRLRTNAILGLRSINIRHSTWLKAMEIIVESIVVQSTKQYVRVYTRPDTDAEFDLIPLNIAAA